MRTRLIRSRDNPGYKSVAHLCHSSRERKSAQRSLLEGVHTARAYAQRYGAPEQFVVSEDGLADAQTAQLLELYSEVPRLLLSAPLFARLSEVASPGGLITIVRTPQPKPEGPARFSLLLEDLQDPGNLGSALRSAAGAGVARVYLSPGCAFAWSAKTVRAGQGAHFFLDIVEGADLLQVARAFAGTVVAAVPTAPTRLFDLDLRGPLAFAVGNEGAGLSAELAAACSHRAAIPMPGGIESLNAAVAAAICLFEKVRQDAM